MLSLTDEIWKKLDRSGLSRKLWSEAQEDFHSESKMELLYGQLCHQFSIAPAAYALMPGLFEIASKSDDIETQVEIVLFGGTIDAFSEYDKSEDNSLKIRALHRMKIEPEVLQILETEYFQSL